MTDVLKELKGLPGHLTVKFLVMGDDKGNTIAIAFDQAWQGQLPEGWPVIKAEGWRVRMNDAGEAWLEPK